MTVQEIHRRFVAGELSLVERVEQFLKAIDRQQLLNAFVEVYREEALARARALEIRREKGEALGPLAGLVVAIKDNICYQDHGTTCASHILEGFVSPYSATVVKKMLAADAVIIGRTNMDEFAMGSSNENSYYGPVKNPHNPEYVPGGSSGGSAVAVAAGMADLALGSDTGGSIRQPAAFCGVVGLKPTYGLVSRYGLVAFASSLDQIGPFGRTVADVAYFTPTFAGHDPCDSTSVPFEIPDYIAQLKDLPQKLTIGLPEEYFQEGIDPQVRDRVMGAVEALKKQAGITVKPVHLPLTDYAIATYYIIATAEASSNLARYDGVRYGYRAREVEDLQEMYFRTRSEGFGREVKRRIMLGTFVLSSGYYEAYYRKAQQVRRLIKEEFDRAFQEVDLLITPTSPTPAFRLGEKLDDPLKMYLSDIYTVTVNLAGICALSMPCGSTEQGLPVGLQIIGGPFQETRLFQCGHLLEQLLGP
ncbi:MAG: Asp-tRNA(Asn)/Glu-tRNA(Gln) amidotransferase subunit GatA [Calditrichaeota bacterium]|nr:MAG: Asp-tRNA(Asn)/Glu-tRNA(Gln) amidotransferase subunit GatA [Calditrichota bacterium]